MRILWIPCLLCLFVIACADPNKTLPITGNVNLDGTPVGDGNDALIRFEPTTAKGNTGESFLKDGKYQVNLVEGSYKVLVTWNKSTGKKQKSAIAGPGQETAQTVSVIPSKYNSETTLTAEINSGKLTHNFDLKK